MSTLERQIAYMKGVSEKAAMVAAASNTDISRSRAAMFADVLESLRELHVMKEETRKLLEGFGPNFNPEVTNG